MLNQPSNITPDEINGTGTVDVTADVTVSWQVSGDSAMTAYKIDIQENTAASTQVYSTGKITLSTPFWGTNYAGAVQFYTVKLDSSDLTTAGMTNGNEYKLLITQWWSANDSVQQTTASLFITRNAPTLALTAIPDPVDATKYSFTATYSQAQGDPMKWVRWQIAYDDDTENPFLDTGNIYGTGQLRVDYDGFLTDTDYAIKCSVETSNGIGVDTGWETFSVSYELDPTPSGTARACVVRGDSCVWVNWDQVESADGYSILRQTVGENRLIRIADVESTAGQLRDYSAQSGNTYIYYIFPVGNLSYLTFPLVTEPITVQYWFWSIIEAQEVSENNFSVMASHIFKYGSGGVAEGSFSNNNSPTIQQNFTKYPTRQGVTANYLTGSVSGYIGTVNRDTVEYSDTIAQSDAIFKLSNSENALFLTDPKGHFLRIHTAGATTLTIDNKKAPMPQTMSFNWVEVGSTDNVHTIMYSGGDFYPVDRVILSTLSIDTTSGSLLWTVPDNYSGTGSVLYLGTGEDTGALMQDDTGPFNPATMTIDYTDGTVSATLGE